MHGGDIYKEEIHGQGIYRGGTQRVDIYGRDGGNIPGGDIYGGDVHGRDIHGRDIHIYRGDIL